MSKVTSSPTLTALTNNEKSEIIDDKDGAYLDQDEITQLFDSLDADQDGLVTAEDIDQQLRLLLDRLSPPTPCLSHLACRPTRRYKASSDEFSVTMRSSARLVEDTGLMHFTEQLLPDDTRRYSRAQFASLVRRWEIPSQKTIPHQTLDERELHRVPLRRRMRAYFDVHGPNLAFFAAVLALQLGCATWQLIKFLNKSSTRHAFGAGLIISKGCAGALYPTLFFLVMSMSRRATTWLRKWRFLSRAINWDKSRTFHVCMAMEALLLGTIHGISHMGGTFTWGTRPENRQMTADLIHSKTPLTYSWLAQSLPTWTGLAALFQFWIIALLALPVIRKRWHELFQLGHLLMFPLIALLLLHGTAALIQKPMLQFWLLPPACLVFGERVYRHLILPLRPSRARPTILPGDITRLTIMQPNGKNWKHAAGQYVLIRVPAISRFQWHPFTVSACEENRLAVHIKADGSWTTALGKLASAKDSLLVNVDGPFGAPAQRFYDYDYAIVVGGGIGITPFSAILNDMENSYSDNIDPWDNKKHRWIAKSLQSLPATYTSRWSRENSNGSILSGWSGSSNPPSTACGYSGTSTPQHQTSLESSFYSSIQSSSASFISSAKTLGPKMFPKRRVDLHWTVRERNNIHWFSDLLNRVIARAPSLADSGKLQIDINTHITAPKRDIRTHVFSHLLDSYRASDGGPLSLLTGVKQPSNFGRPDFKSILRNHLHDLIDSGVKEMRVGVFYCGTPIVGEILSDACHTLTATARTIGVKIRYEFLMEVFG